MGETELENQEVSVSRRVLDRISKENLKMRPSCVFIAVSWLWLLTAAAIFFVSVVLLILSFRYIDLAEPTILFFEKPFVLLTSLPYFLFTITVIFLILSAMAYRKSRCCCRHENWMLMSFLMFSAFVIGFSAYNAHLDHGLAERIEDNKRINAFMKTPAEFWYQPEKGTLSGVVAGQLGEGAIQLVSWNGLIWHVAVKGQQDVQIQNKMPIKMIGEKSGTLLFEAKRIFEW